MTEQARKKGEVDRRSMEMIRRSGLLNPDVTLGQLMDLTQELMEEQARLGSDGGETEATKTFITGGCWVYSCSD